jgi:hypothetical protein
VATEAPPDRPERRARRLVRGVGQDRRAILVDPGQLELARGLERPLSVALEVEHRPRR